MIPFCLNARRSGFTLIELLVVIAIIGVLMALLVPAIGKAQKNAHRVACISNLKQMGLATYQYNEEKNELPVSNATSSGNDPRGWRLLLAPYLSVNTDRWWADHALTKGVFRCAAYQRPSGNADARWDGGYGWNYRYMGHKYSSTGYSPPRKLEAVPLPGETILIGDTTDWTTPSGNDWLVAYLYPPTGVGGAATPRIGNRHRQGINLLWADFHVAWASTEDLSNGKSGKRSWYYLMDK